jgi:hypothetical protein
MSLTPYNPTVNFAQEETNNVSGRNTVRTNALDTEFANINTAMDSVHADLTLIQRSDGKLRDQVVEQHSLHPDVVALLGTTLVPRGNWLTTTAYAVYDLVSQSGNTYVCVTAHTSGTFATDLAANKWMVFSYNNASDAELLAIAGLSSAADTVPYFTGSGTAALATLTSAGRNLIDDANASTQRITLGLQEMGVPSIVMNGAFQILRDPTVTSNTPAANTVTHLLQRWYTYMVGGSTGNVTQSQQASGLTAYPSCARILRGAGTVTDTRFTQVLTSELSRLAASKALTIKFWARKGSSYSATSSNLYCRVISGTGTDQSSTSMEGGTWTGQTTVLNSPSVLTTSWQEFSLITSAMGSTVNQIAFGFQMPWTGTGGANDYVEITGVRIGISGVIEIPVIDVPVDIDRIRCLEFYEVIGDGAQLFSMFAPGQCTSTTQGNFVLKWQRKRIPPAITVSAGSHFFINCGTGSAACTSVAPSASSLLRDRTWLTGTTAGSLTSGNGALLHANNTTAARIYIDAEI